MQRFKSLRQAQRFLSAHSFIYAYFRPRLYAVDIKASFRDQMWFVFH